VPLGVLLSSFRAKGVAQHARAAGQRAAGDGTEVVGINGDAEADDARPSRGIRLMAAKELEIGDERDPGHLEVVGDDDLESGLEHCVQLIALEVVLCGVILTQQGCDVGIDAGVIVALFITV